MTSKILAENARKLFLRCLDCGERIVYAMTVSFSPSPFAQCNYREAWSRNAVGSKRIERIISLLREQLSKDWLDSGKARH
jgi:fructoselysine-6-P-deglycase FrlB-like protein